MLVLPDAAREIIHAQPRLGDNPYVFAGHGDGPYNGFGKSKARLDGKLPEGTRGMDNSRLRRTARCLMSRAGVRANTPSASWGTPSQASRASMTAIATATKRPTRCSSSRR